ncbi:MAG TPA: LysR family transcriptional regulator [Bacilli bacterium]|nr:LysR family transcriptional regulator [Bacilli bacterium]
MKLQQIRYFLEVVRWGSFSKAAAALYISQPALSKSISQLEAGLHTNLFERTHKGLVLTEQGKRFYERVKPVIEELELILHDTAHPRELAVGMLPTIGSYYFPALAAVFESHRLIPSFEKTSRALYQKLDSGEVEAAIVQELVEAAGYSKRFLFAEPYLVALPTGHPLASRKEISLQDVAGEKLLFSLPGCDARCSLLEGFSQQGLPVDIHMEAPYETLLGYTAAGVGLSFVPDLQARNSAHKGVVFKRIAGQPLTRNLYLVARSPSLLDLFAAHVANPFD